MGVDVDDYALRERWGLWREVTKSTVDVTGRLEIESTQWACAEAASTAADHCVANKPGPVRQNETDNVPRPARSVYSAVPAGAGGRMLGFVLFAVAGHAHASRPVSYTHLTLPTKA